MRLLAVDIGQGTQDLLLLDTKQNIENCPRLITPSCTQLVARQIEAATRKRQDILLTGFIMGGGPNTRALKDHLTAGVKAFSTPTAARTFCDDLEKVKEMGVVLVSEDEAKKMGGVLKIELRDIRLEDISRALSALGVEPSFDALAVAVMDHGEAPLKTSDRYFRFQHLRRSVEKGGDFISFSYLRDEIPGYLTRMRSLASSMELDATLLVMDTGAAAALGSLEDREVKKHGHLSLVNAGNGHTLAFHLKDRRILGLFEHHSGKMTGALLSRLVEELVRGKLTMEKVYDDGGHGCYVIGGSRGKPFVSITGPRREVASGLGYYMAAPFGDMMLTGCFGLARALSWKKPQWREEIESVLGKSYLR